MLWQQLDQASFADLGFSFYGPLIGILVLILVGVPVWVSLRLGVVGILWFTETLPMTLVGASLFQGIDHFALIAVPLFILTGDVLVRTDLSEKLLNVAQALTGGVRSGLLVPVIILGGIYSGVFTPTEAAAVAVTLTIVIGLAQGTLTLADFPKMLVSSAKVNGIILPIIAISLPLSQALAALQVPQAFVEAMTSVSPEPMVIILMMVAILILAGLIMETTPNIVILAPLLLPLAQEIGMNEIHFCVLMITALGVGFITPPFGLNLFVISGITGTPVLSIAARAIPYVLGMLAVVLILAFVPALSLWAF